MSDCLWKYLKKFFYLLFFFCGNVKLICELRHKLFINLQLRKINHLRPSAQLLRNLRSTAGKFTHSVVCGSTYVPPVIFKRESGCILRKTSSARKCIISSKL